MEIYFTIHLILQIKKVGDKIKKNEIKKAIIVMRFLPENNISMIIDTFLN